jgi:hypothetical protein
VLDAVDDDLLRGQRDPVPIDDIGREIRSGVREDDHVLDCTEMPDAPAPSIAAAAQFRRSNGLSDIDPHSREDIDSTCRRRSSNAGPVIGTSRDDLAEHIAETNACRLLIDISCVDVIDSCIARVNAQIAGVARVLDQSRRSACFSGIAWAPK